MGNDASAMNKLTVKSRMLENQLKYCHDNQSLSNHLQHIRETKDYHNLILSGGGFKSLSQLGALDQLAESGYLKNLKTIACTSYMSIAVFLYLMDCPFKQIHKILTELPWSKMLCPSKSQIAYHSDIYHINSSLNLNNNGQFLHDILAELVGKHSGNRHYTLNNLWKDKGINLVFYLTDLCTRKLVKYDHISHPNVPIRVLLRACCTIPPLIPPIILDGTMIADGSIVDICPINLFDDYVSSTMNIHSFGIKVVGDLAYQSGINLTDDANHREPLEVTDVSSYLACLSNLLEETQMIHLPMESQLRCLTLHTPAYPLTKAKLSKTDLSNLMKSGNTILQPYE